ncbi:MAG: hydrogenase maturation nickel metallochaperone HypA [Paludibacterium sp.]|uniref:hydrogenase maturation nickel metallochaperone HypA n=1 Tax=Paludibacterium sp. TaxID=1917523 RepID=UPI0025D17468|nr:hydrogenase maturation nickel metallochaperone HypA [Paludibacterium sp.]MBV8047924.1 hydrogenase maturation nickel metallochaperone HypA [Paludibacterium sp.]MBV8647676.1 hydrogenase maturation nickel metallochaperone HypA [Paludibacterium sp.]
MHEMSLAEGVLQLLEEQAETQRYHKVKQVWLNIGELAGVDVDALTFSLEVVCRDSLADGAVFHIVREPGRGWCLQCSREVELPTRYHGCPHCGRYQIQVTGGTDMRVGELEVE